MPGRELVVARVKTFVGVLEHIWGRCEIVAIGGVYAGCSEARTCVGVVVQNGEAQPGAVGHIVEEAGEGCSLQDFDGFADAFFCGDDWVDAQHGVMQGESLIAERPQGVYLVIGQEAAGFHIGPSPARTGTVQDKPVIAVLPQVEQHLGKLRGDGLGDDDGAVDLMVPYLGKPGVDVTSAVAPFGESDFYWHFRLSPFYGISGRFTCRNLIGFYIVGGAGSSVHLRSFLSISLFMMPPWSTGVLKALS